MYSPIKEERKPPCPRRRGLNAVTKKKAVTDNCLDARRRLINMLEAIDGVEGDDELAMIVETVNKFLNELDIRSDGADIDDYIRRHFSSFGDTM